MHHIVLIMLRQQLDSNLKLKTAKENKGCSILSVIFNISPAFSLCEPYIIKQQMLKGPSHDKNLALRSLPGRAQSAGTVELRYMSSKRASQSLLLGISNAGCHPGKLKRKKRGKKSLFSKYLSLSQKKALYSPF